MAKILIDFRRYFDKTGISSYLKSILCAIINNTDNKYYILINKNDKTKIEEIVGCNIKIIYAASKPFSFLSNIEIPYLIKKNNIDIFHATHFDIPLFIVLVQCKLISTIHDIIPLKYSYVYKKGLLKYCYFKFMFSMCVLLSKKIITVSEYSKKDLIEYFNIKPEKIVVIYNSFSGKVTHETKRNELNNVLFVGTNFEHKNILCVVKAIKILKDKGFDVHFDIAGARRDYTNIIEDYIKENQLENNIKVWEKVSEEQLDKLYRNANLYVYPSLVEGFGIPLLEAMSYCLPVISSNKTVMPEIVGDAGILIEPTPENFAEKIEYLINNPKEIGLIVEKGLDRIRDFLPDKFNREILNFYDEVMKGL